MSIFGWDLPPGCRISDIPGNRHEDEEWEIIMDKFFDKERLTKTHIGLLITEKQYNQMNELYNNNSTAELIDDYIIAAIEYGIEIGEQKSTENGAENKYYPNMYNEEKRNTIKQLRNKEQETNRLETICTKHSI